MIRKPTDQIDRTDIEVLLTEQVAENKTIEYKLQLPGSSESGKKKFLDAVCSFANTDGGDLIFGVDAKDGIPQALPGISIANFDGECLRLEEMIRSNIDPMLPKFELLKIENNSNVFFVLLRIYPSLALPHWVTFQRKSPFLARGGNGKYHMDISAIRAAFNFAGQLKDKVKNFRGERISEILAGQTPVPMDIESPKVILHIIPSTFWSDDLSITVENLQNKTLAPLGSSGWNHRYNFDGYVTYAGNSSDTIQDSYNQIFRSGILEFVTERLVRPTTDRPGVSHLIPGELFEITLIEAFKTGIEYLRKVGVPFPYFVCLSLVNVQGSKMTGSFFMSDGNIIERTSLIIPDFRYDESAKSIETFMYPIFNYVWNACGIGKSPYYDVSGQRLKRK